MAQDNNYNSYCNQLYYILSARITNPESLVKYQNESPLFVFTFGEQSSFTSTLHSYRYRCCSLLMGRERTLKHM